MRPSKTMLPAWLNVKLIGFEGEEDKGKKPEDENTDDDDDDDDDDDGDKGGKDTGNDGLKSALRKERLARRASEKELKAIKAKLQEQDDKDKSDTEKAQSEAAKAQAKAEKLATRLRNQAVDFEITKLAPKLKFRDIDDALKLVDLSGVDVDQDEDDPSEVTIDVDALEKALKKLAKDKPHLIGGASDGSGEKTGSKFAGSQKSQEQLDEEALTRQYPALRRGSPRQ